MSLELVIGIQLSIVGLLLFGIGPRMRARTPAAGAPVALGVAGLLAVGVLLVALDLSGGSTPMSDVPNPQPATVDSVTIGYGLYQANCAACHGVDARGGGPLAGTTAVTPPSLLAHLGEHTDGDLFYWISNGMPGGMPAWSEAIPEEDRWHLVNFLRSINGQGPTPVPTASAGATNPADSTTP